MVSLPSPPVPDSSPSRLLYVALRSLRWGATAAAAVLPLVLLSACSGGDGGGGTTPPPPPAAVATVTVEPAAATLQVGQTRSLTATPKDAAGNVLTGRAVTWQSADVARATVNNDGVVTAVATTGGTPVTITATIGGVAGTAQITVIPVPVAAVGVALSAPTVIVGQTVQATATTRDAAGNVLAGRAVTWETSDATKATVSTLGVVTGVSVTGGTPVTITARSEGVAGSANLQVLPVPVATVTVALSAQTVFAGQTVQATATTKDAAGNTLTGRTITWTTSDAAKATVNATGLVTTVAAGNVTITATSEGRSGGASLTITQVPVATVQISAPSGVAQIAVGGTLQLTATLKDAQGNTLAGRSVTWASSDVTKATVSATGLVTGVAEATLTSGRSASRRSPGVASSVRATAAMAPVNISATSEGVNAVIPLVVIPATNFPVRTANGGTAHTCAIAMDGDTYCFGRNVNGQLGVGPTPSTSATPLKISGGHQFVAVVTGDAHSCGLTSAGAAWCWGNNSFGQLGDASNTQRTTPVAVSGGRTFASLAARFSHTCGVTTTGQAFCWGLNANGQIGDGTTTNRNVPTAVSTSLTWVKLMLGAVNTCGVTVADTWHCWGGNFNGQLGDGTTNQRLTPGPPISGIGSTPITANHAALRSTRMTHDDDDDDDDDDDGSGYENTHIPAPTLGPALARAGSAPAPGQIVTFGWNLWGQLGRGNTINALSPIAVTINKPGGGSAHIEQVVAGFGHSCALDRDGIAYCTGDNRFGALGTGTTNPAFSYAAVSTTIRFQRLMAGIFHTCAISTGNALYCWGSNNNGQAGVPGQADQRTPKLVQK